MPKPGAAILATPGPLHMPFRLPTRLVPVESAFFISCFKLQPPAPASQLGASLSPEHPPLPPRLTRQDLPVPEPPVPIFSDRCSPFTLPGADSQLSWPIPRRSIQSPRRRVPFPPPGGARPAPPGDGSCPRSGPPPGSTPSLLPAPPRNWLQRAPQEAGLCPGQWGQRRESGKRAWTGAETGSRVSAAHLQQPPYQPAPCSLPHTHTSRPLLFAWFSDCSKPRPTPQHSHNPDPQRWEHRLAHAETRTLKDTQRPATPC